MPTYYRDFTPHNYNRTFDGAVPADRVVERSLNVPSVRMLDKYGEGGTSLRWVRALGFGTIDRSAAHYGAFADSGRRRDFVVGSHVGLH